MFPEERPPGVQPLLQGGRGLSFPASRNVGSHRVPSHGRRWLVTAGAQCPGPLAWSPTPWQGLPSLKFPWGLPLRPLLQPHLRPPPPPGTPGPQSRPALRAQGPGTDRDAHPSTAPTQMPTSSPSLKLCKGLSPHPEFGFSAASPSLQGFPPRPTARTASGTSWHVVL